MKSTISCRKSSPAILLLGLFAISGCNSERFLFETTSVAASLPDSTMVVLLTGVDFRHVDGQKIGTFFYDEGDAWPGVGFYRMEDYLRTMALQKGANLVLITITRQPYRGYGEKISAEFYRVTDARGYTREDVIEWSADRKLSFDDFKYQGRISSEQKATPSNGSYDFDILTKFYCEHSWINRASRDSAEVLLHEQGNFDLCEIYRRQFMDPIRQGDRLGTLIWSIRAKWKAKRGQYESQTAGGLDYRRQAEWTAKIHRALEAPFFLTM